MYHHSECDFDVLDGLVAPAYVEADGGEVEYAASVDDCIIGCSFHGQSSQVVVLSVCEGDGQSQVLCFVGR